MSKNVICIALVFGLVGSASAVIIIPPIEPPGLIDDYVEIPAGVTVVWHERVDFDAGGELHVYGTAIMEGACKFPDNSGYQGVKAFIYNGGLWDAHDIENRASERGDWIKIFASGTLIVRTGYGTGDQWYDPLMWEPDGALLPGDDAPYLEYTDLGGGAGQIHGLPEPATIMLLGLGGLALLRRKR